MNRVFSLIFLLGTGTLAGCGTATDANQQPVYPVTGTVTMFGAPLADAMVAFAPLESQPTAIGRTDSEGKFVLTSYDYGDGAAEGKFKVVINKSAPAPATSDSGAAGGGGDHEAAEEAAGSHDAESASGAAGADQLVPPQYTTSTDTPLSADVKASGENNFTFEIK